MIEKELADTLQKLKKMMEENNIKIVLAKSHDQTPDHIVQERVEKMSNGLTIIDHLNLIKLPKE